MSESFYSSVLDAPVTKTEILKMIPSGKENAVTSTHIARKLGISDHGTETSLRKCIRDAINEGELIASCSEGYFRMENYEEFTEYLDSLAGRIEGISQRISRLRVNWQNRKTPIQGDIFDG